MVHLRRRSVDGPDFTFVHVALTRLLSEGFGGGELEVNVGEPDGFDQRRWRQQHAIREHVSVVVSVNDDVHPNQAGVEFLKPEAAVFIGEVLF